MQNDNISEEFIELLQTSSTETEVEKISPDSWEGLEEIQLEKWQREVQEYKIAAGQSANYKLESIRNNFINRKRILETKIADIEDSSIKKMYRKELENAVAQYECKVEEIAKKKSQADIHVTLIARGILHIQNI